MTELVRQRLIGNMRHCGQFIGATMNAKCSDDLQGVRGGRLSCEVTQVKSQHCANVHQDADGFFREPHTYGTVHVARAFRIKVIKSDLELRRAPELCLGHDRGRVVFAAEMKIVYASGACPRRKRSGNFVWLAVGTALLILGFVVVPRGAFD